MSSIKHNSIQADAELEALRRECAGLKNTMLIHDKLFDEHEAELAASQAYSQQLREALAFYMTPPIGQLNERHVAAAKLGVAALALPHDDTALKQYGAKLLRRAADQVGDVCRDDIRRMADELEDES